jgi:hypothetical protein
MQNITIACECLDDFGADPVPVEENPALMRHPSSRNNAGEIQETEKEPLLMIKMIHEGSLDEGLQVRRSLKRIELAEPARKGGTLETNNLAR